MKVSYIALRRVAIATIVVGVLFFVYPIVEGVVLSLRIHSIDIAKIEGQIKEITDAYSQSMLKLDDEGIFSSPSSKSKLPVITGILGDSVLTNTKWYKVGDKIGKATVLSIEADHILVKWQGREVEVSPIQSSLDERRKQVSLAENNSTNKKNSKTAVLSDSTVAQAQEDDFTWLGQIPNDLRSHIIQLYNVMNDEMKQEFRQHWEEASQSERQEALSQFKDAIDSGKFQEMLSEISKGHS